MAGTIVIVDPYSSGNMFAPALRRAGFSPVAVLSGADPVFAGTLRAGDFDELIRHDGAFESLRARIASLAPLAIVPGSDTGVLLSDQLATRLTPGLANDVTLAVARRDKGAMLSAVAARGLPVIRTLCTSAAGDVTTWLIENELSGHDLVLKPAQSAGSDGVVLAPGGADNSWLPAFNKLLGSVNRYGYRNDQVIVQEYVTGTEYALDAFSYEGIHTINAISRYRKVRNGKHVAIYDTIEILRFDEPEHAPVIGYFEQVLDALGVTFGVSHTEIMLTRDGPLLIETHMRPSGGGQPWVCQLATGDNAIDRMARYLRGEPPRRDYALSTRTLVVYLIARRSGRASNVAALSAIEDLPSCCYLQVNIKDGDAIPETADIFDSQRLGVAVLSHDSRDQLAADNAELRRIESNLVISDT